MHAVEIIDIYIRLSVNVTGGKHGKHQGEIATGLYTVLRGVGGQKWERYIAIVWFYPASESRLPRSVTFKLQRPIVKRSKQAFLFSRESYSLLMHSHQRRQVERYVRHVSHIRQFDSQISWEYNSQCAIPHCIDQMVVTDPNFVVVQSNVAQNVS